MQVTLNETELYILLAKLSEMIKSEPSAILAQVLTDIQRKIDDSKC